MLRTYEAIQVTRQIFFTPLQQDKETMGITLKISNHF